MQVSRRIQNRWKKGQTEETDTYLMCKYQANRQMYLVSLSLWVRILTVMTRWNILAFLETYYC